MKLLQVVPDAPYYIWQLYIQMLNFRKLGIEKKATILIGLGIPEPSQAMKDFEAWTEAEVLYYQDTRTSKVYPSGVRPNILKQYFKQMESWDRVPEVYFYHDQDIIFLRPIDWAALEAGDECYVSMSAHNYISWDYLQQWKKHMVHGMFEIVGIDPKLVEQNNKHTGGAQHVMKGLGSEYWEKVDRDCEALYRWMYDSTHTGILSPYVKEDLPKHHIQIWTADMWAVLWNMWLFGKTTRWHPEIDFCWPYDPITTPKPIMHNAGITASNDTDKDGKRRYFNKSLFNGEEAPFGHDHSYVSPAIAQSEYIKLMYEITQSKNIAMQQEKRRFKILGVFCTTNKLHPDLLKLTLERIRVAAESTTEADVKIITCSWEPIPGNPFMAITTPFRNMGHLNYLLQIKQALIKDKETGESDIVAMLEHDMMYPPNYFDRIAQEWDGGKYGLTMDNYIGMNETGYLNVVERHQPMSLMAMAKFYLDKNLNIKIDEALKNISPQSPFGSCCVEPDNKADFKRVPFTNYWPAIHVNMNHMGHWGSGAEGKNHHLTNHCGVCYEDQSGGKVDRPDDWGSFHNYFTFNSKS